MANCSQLIFSLTLLIMILKFDQKITIYALSFYPNCFGQIKKRFFIFKRQLLNHVQKFGFDRSKKGLDPYKDQTCYISKLIYLFLWNFRSKQLKRNNLLFISLFFYSTFFKRRPWPWKTCSYSLAFPHRSSLFVKLRNLYNDIISQARTYELQDCYRDQFNNKVTIVQVNPQLS